ncbi:DUF2255 family protein [Promicromonospora sp. NPDC019610]|uniref:DUF2255 family protein n=1 Tax=Promicromonospora sp. NPDC019610 TaxID=3364405 RepID=UPI0037938739
MSAGHGSADPASTGHGSTDDGRTGERATRPWTEAELALLARTELIRVAGARDDGTLRSFALVGHVRLGRDELVRSLNGPDGGWYRGAIRSGHGEIDVDGRRIAVAFVRDVGRAAAVDQALRDRYGHDAGVRRMTRAPARDATLRAVPLRTDG